MLTVGRNHIFTEHIESVTTPSTQANQRDAAVIRYSSGREEIFFGPEAEQVREWLASHREANASPVAPITTKSPPAAVAKPTVATK